MDDLTIIEFLPDVRAIGLAFLDKNGVAIESEAITFRGLSIVQLALFENRWSRWHSVIWKNLLNW